MWSSNWLLALLLLVVLQHALIAAIPLRGPSSKAAKPRFFRIKEHVSRMLGRGAGPTKPSSPIPEEEEGDELDKSYRAELRKERENEDSKELDKSWEDYVNSPAWTFRRVLGGALKAIPVCLVLFPLDTIRTRLQASNSEQLLTSGKLLHGLYDGLGPALVCTALLGAYENLWLDLPVMFRLRAIRLFTNLLVRVPFEVVKQRRQAGLDATWQAAVSCLLASRGLTGFYMGWAAMALRMAPVYYAQSQMTSMFLFRLLKPLKDKGVWPTGKDGQPLGLFKVMLHWRTETVIPFMVALLMTPMDVVMTRLMTQSATGQYQGLLDCLLTIVKNEGLSALFVGLGPRFLTLAFGPNGPLSLARLAFLDY